MSEPSGGLPRPATHPAEFDAGFQQHAGYAAALTHLYGRLNTEGLDPATFARVERNLDSLRAFLRELGDPHLGRPTIHVTGTRGKGSTVAMLESILVAAGVRTGATVSPHLMEVRERIRLSREDLSRAEFARLYAIMRPVAEQRMNGINFRTVFELLTALAFITFKDQDVEAALVEVGMGGKLDATNVVEPCVSIVTRVGMDHTHILGNTLEEIASDKSYIIKPGGPAILSRQDPRALAVLEARCHEVGVDCWRLDQEVQLENERNESFGTAFTVTTPLRRHEDLHTPLLGLHQVENAASAVAAADRLHADGVFSIPPAAVREGLAATRWPGRAEVLEQDPMVMIDGAHTSQGATALNRLLEDRFHGWKRVFILGMNRDKDADGFLDCFTTAPDLVLATRADSPRSFTADELADRVRRRGWPVETVNLADALNAARQNLNGPGLILGTGSFYVIGALRRVWLLEKSGSATFTS